jgi:stage II sporulation protein AA (anti-sigma F factor antagonist)
MDMVVEELSPGIVKVALNGRLDIAGCADVDASFRNLAETSRSMVIDLSAVTFMASMGIRILLVGAKALSRRAGKLVLLKPEPDVAKMLQLSGIADLMPIHSDLDDALAAVRS